MSDVTFVLLLVGGVVVLNVFALLLVLLRPVLFGVRLYRPMVLNVALSVAPAVMMALTILGAFAVVTFVPSQAALLAVLVVGGLVWLLLLPNAGYLITELNFSHRRPNDPVPLWYDIVAVLSLAMSGVMNTLVNVLLAQVAYLVLTIPNDPRPLQHLGSWVMTAITLVLVSVGIYLGRYVRFNTWDLLHPRSFVRKLVGHLRERGALRQLAGFALLHTLFFAILYLVVVAPAVTVLDAPS